MIRNFPDKKEFLPFTHEEIEQARSIIHNAQQHNVGKIINVGTDLIESLSCIELANIFPECVATIGLHPTDAHDAWRNDITTFKRLLTKKDKYKIVSIGECGVDKYHDGYNAMLQEQVFRAQIELALEHNIPLIIHSRNADIETYEILSSYKHEKKLKGTIHCFSSNLDYAHKYIELGFVLGFGGTLTYPKNSVLRDVAATIPLTSIILETDAPFLPPQIIRGKQNSPSHIQTIFQFLKTLRPESLETIESTIMHTTQTLFNI